MVNVSIALSIICCILFCILLYISRQLILTIKQLHKIKNTYTEIEQSIVKLKEKYNTTEQAYNLFVKDHEEKEHEYKIQINNIKNE